MVASAPEPDDVLWQRSGGGDDRAFTALFERHSRAVYNYAFRRTGSWAAADDLLSTTFLEAWRRCGTVELTSSSALPWLLGVTTNLLRNHWRSDRRRAAAVAGLRAVPQAGHEEEVVARLAAEEQCAAVVSRLEALPAAERDVVGLVVLGELSYSDAAAALGIPIGTVRSRLARARSRLHPTDEHREPPASSGHDHGDDFSSTTKP